jgi:glycosyltransferase involved in cell wall biosynthesis
VNNALQNPKPSIILATYQWPEALALVLSALLTQSEKSFEVMIADDGSDERTKKVIADYSARAFFPIKHFWQENKGFRKSRILNEAIRAARGDTLIFLDGDCVPHKEFVAQHVALQDGKHYVAGRRVDLSKEFTARLTPAEIEKGALNGLPLGLFRLWMDSIRKTGSTPFHRAYMVKNPLLRKVFGMEKVVDLKGCNFSAKREHMLAIDGFDESYEGYGREDTDVEIRLQNLGLKIRSAKNLCLQFHLWHEQRGFTPVNEDLLEDVKRTRRVKAKRGLGLS